MHSVIKHRRIKLTLNSPLLSTTICWQPHYPACHLFKTVSTSVLALQRTWVVTRLLKLLMFSKLFPPLFLCRFYFALTSSQVFNLHCRKHLPHCSLFWKFIYILWPPLHKNTHWVCIFSFIYTVKLLIRSVYNMLILTSTRHVRCGSGAVSDKVNTMSIVKLVILQFPDP